MTLLYWLLEYGKVHVAYMVLVFVWPSLIFRKYLRGKSLTFRFAFCATASTMLLSTFVLLVGLIGLLKPWLFRVLFYGSMAVSVYRGIPNKRNALKQAARVLVGTYGFKQLLLMVRTAIATRIRRVVNQIYDRITGHVGEYILLAVVLLYGMIYFTYGAFQDYSYGFGDMYPHNAWVYGLTQGNVFSAGVYPEGMHCFIYAMHVLFGIRIYNCMLFTAGVHVLTFLLSAYCMLKAVFRSRYTPILALTLFLTMDLQCVDEVYSMSRLQWTIPQEFGLYSLFLCGGFLARYLRSGKREPGDSPWEHSALFRRLRKWHYNDDLLIFMMALACSLIIHFYVTIMAFFLCVAFVPLAIIKICHPKRLIPLVTAVLTGCFIAILPMGLALASGIPFQGSIGWAVNVINGTDTGTATGAVVLDEKTGEEITGDISSIFGGKKADQDAPKEEQQENQNDGMVSAGDVIQTVEKPHGMARIKALAGKLREKADIAYLQAYITLYGVERAAKLMKMTLLAFALFLLCRIGLLVYTCVLKREARQDAFDGYFALPLATMIFMVMYCADKVGLPNLIAGSRLCAVTNLMLMGVCVIPADLVLFVLGLKADSRQLTKLAWFSTAGIYLGTLITGCFHGYLYYELTRYNGAVMCTYAITKQVPKSSFTIVSTVDELYQAIEYGFHEEAIQFINECVGQDYVLPTEYVFVFVEKHPLEYGQSHFFGGPKWLAWEKYPAIYGDAASQCPHVNAGVVLPELAENPIYQYPVSSAAYSSLLPRMVVESRLVRWCNEFDRLYPNELHTYYEDEDFVCYYFRQNPSCLYQLGIQ
ncbi:MAG: hypothetical protein IJ747_01675 [Lachnospiraceae bacterium]|nr:hypothetical protein [Lachnospiraceae bacterium]